MAAAVDSQILVSKIDYLKNQVIPKYKEFFEFFIEEYSKKQSIQFSDTKPDLSHFQSLHSKFLTNTNLLKNTLENFKSKIKEIKFFIAMKTQETSAENEKLSKMTEKLSHIEHINKFLLSDQESLSIEINTKKQVLKFLHNQINLSINSQNFKLRSNLSAVCENEKKKMSVFDSISVNKNSLKKLKNQVFNKELELFEKSKSLNLLKEQKIFMIQEKKNLENEYEKLKNERIDVELNLEFIERSIELVDKDNQGVRFSHEKMLSKCSDEAIKIEKIKNSKAWKEKDLLERDLREQEENFEIEKKNFVGILSERKKRIFEIMYDNYRIIKAFYTFFIYSETKKFYEKITNEKRNSLLMFEELKQEEKEEKIKHYDSFQSKHSKKETRKSVKKPKEKDKTLQNLPVLSEKEEKEKTGLTLKVFPVECEENPILIQKSDDMEIEIHPKAIKENEKKKQADKKSKSSAHEDIKKNEKKHKEESKHNINLPDSLEEVNNQDHQESQFFPKAKRKSSVKDQKIENVENFSNPLKPKQYQSYSTKGKKTPNYNKNLVNSIMN